MEALDITRAYSGSWHSDCYNIQVKYNANVWSEILSQDFAEDTFFSLFDRRDGSAILLRVERLKGIASMTDHSIESTLANSLQKSYPGFEVMQRLRLCISRQDFYAVDYSIYNKKFGQQVVRHAFTQFEGVLLILLFTWPLEAYLLEPHQLPSKHNAFIHGLELGMRATCETF